MQSIRQKWGDRSPKPFARLVHLFVGRIFHGGEHSEGELDLSMGLALSLLALPGAFYSILSLDKYSTLLQWMRGQHDFDPLAAALPDEYFLIVLSMVVTGAVAVWRWDSLFPDRRDYANLVSLPISTRNIFLANLTAVGLMAVVLALDVNAVSAVVFPLVVSGSADTFSFFAHFIAVHALAVLLASVFSFFVVFAAIGILAVALPYAVFRRFSFYLRGTIIACLIATLSTSFAVPPLLAHLPETPAKFLPPVWFLGLCQLIRGRASPGLAMLGRVALVASGCIVVAAVTIYALSYRRCFVRIPETTSLGSGTKGAHLSWIFPALDRTVLISPFRRGAYRFVMKTLLRSERHGLVLAGFFGLAVVIASQFLLESFDRQEIGARGTPSSQVLAIPLILSYCISLGIRFAFDIPNEIHANWVFRLSLDRIRHECIPLARAVILSFILPWVFAIVLPVYGYLWGWRVGAMQIIVVPIWSMLLTEILLLRFRKLPFTCSYPPFRHSAGVLLLLCVLGFFAFVLLTSTLEHRALLKPVLMVWFVVLPLAAAYTLLQIHRGTGEIDKELIFEEKEDTELQLLDLRRGS